MCCAFNVFTNPDLLMFCWGVSHEFVRDTGLSFFFPCPVSGLVSEERWPLGMSWEVIPPLVCFWKGPCRIGVLGWSHPPTSASQRVRITGLSPLARPKVLDSDEVQPIHFHLSRIAYLTPRLGTPSLLSVSKGHLYVFLHKFYSFKCCFMFRSMVHLELNFCIKRKAWVVFFLNMGVQLL